MVFQPGVFTQTLTLNTITELASEGDEQLRATLTAATSGVGITADTATVTITEDGVFETQFHPIKKRLHDQHHLHFM